MDKKNIVLEKLHELNELYLKAPTQSANGINPSEEILLEMELFLMNYLEKHPQDTDMWLKLTMVEFSPPWGDYDRIEKYINSILEYDKNNIQSLLILAYAQYVYRGEVKDNLFLSLQHCCDIITNKELLSMVYLAIAWYYSSRDELEYEKSLLQSISYCSKYVKNYLRLGELYLKIGKKVEGKKVILIALKNITKIYNQGTDLIFDITDIDRFFNEYFKGIHVSRPNYQGYIDYLINYN